MSAAGIPPSTVATTTGSAMAASAPAASTSAASGAAGGNVMDTDELIVYWLDIALLCVVGVFFLAGLPRAVARFTRFSEWGRGQLFFSSSTVKRRPVRSNSPAGRLHRQYTNATHADYTTDQSHTYVMHEYPEKGQKRKSSFPNSTNPPAHVPALSTIFHPISSVFLYSVAPGKSIGKLTIAALFIVALIILTFVLDGEPLTSPERFGWFATGLIPVSIALGTKNNLIGMVVGMGYERLNFLHRWVGVISFVTANLHAISYIYKWAFENTLSESFEKAFIIHGVISLVGLELLYLGSLGWVRNKAYNLFLFSHVAGYCTFLIALCFHKGECIKWVVIGVGIYALDHLTRIFKTRFAIARIKAVPELGLVRIEVPSIKSGWRAGQHVRLRVLSWEMGTIRWSVAHPFTIANASNSEADKGMVLLVKKAGNWTNRLYDAAGRAGYYASECGYETQREMSVIVEGPYGGLGNMVMSSFSSAMLVGGGSGVTFTLSQAEELVQAVCEGKSALKFIEIIWITQDQASLTPLVPEFSTLLENVAPIPGVLLKISIFYSRASKRPLDVKDQNNAAYIASLAPSLSVQPGRPMLPRILDGLVRLTSALQRAKGVAIGVCGPIELVEDVQRASRSINSDLRSACGGVEVHEEVFGW